jgi:hypothetical protein
MGGKEEDWTVTHENVVERFERGKRLAAQGKIEGYAILLYCRMFKGNGGAQFNDRLENEVLGLEMEDLDEATRVGVEMALEHEKGRRAAR